MISFFHVLSDFLIEANDKNCYIQNTIIHTKHGFAKQYFKYCIILKYLFHSLFHYNQVSKDKSKNLK